MADVTTEALQTVKNALSTFQTDISGLSMRATDNADDITEECKGKINLTKTEIAPVSYTHLDVYKRQPVCRASHTHFSASISAKLYCRQSLCWKRIFSAHALKSACPAVDVYKRQIYARRGKVRCGYYRAYQL